MLTLNYIYYEGIVHEQTKVEDLHVTFYSVCSGKVIKILLFNTTGDRDVTQLLRPLMVKYSYYQYLNCSQFDDQ